MTIIEIIDVFVFYGVDVILLASATAAAVQILKISLLKNVQKKLLTFLPFIIGTVFYAVYAGVYNKSAVYVLVNYVSVLEHGISVGAVATFVYVLYEQFVRQDETSSATEKVIATLIDGYVPSDALESTAKQIAAAIAQDVTGTGASKTAEILKDNSLEEVSEQDLQLLSKLIIQTLAHLSAA